MVNQAYGVRLRLLVAVVAVAAGASWIVLRLLQASGRQLPEPSWLAVVILLALSVGLILAGRPVKRLVAGTAERPVHPLYAARVLAMAQAVALGGAAALGWYLAQVTLVLPDADIASQQARILQLVLLGLAAGALCGVGLLVQRWCRLDDDEDRERRGGQEDADPARH